MTLNAPGELTTVSLSLRCVLLHTRAAVSISYMFSSDDQLEKSNYSKWKVLVGTFPVAQLKIN